MFETVDVFRIVPELFTGGGGGVAKRKELVQLTVRVPLLPVKWLGGSDMLLTL
jgi:hypothetical protein